MKHTMITKKSVNDLSYKIVGCAIEVHNHLGPGLLETIYEECLIEELRGNGFLVQSQVPVSIVYKEKKLKHPLYLDILVEDTIIIELKAVEVVHPVHKAQLLSYMKLAQKPKGLLLNFHTESIISGLTPLVNHLFAKLPD